MLAALNCPLIFFFFFLLFKFSCSLIQEPCCSACSLLASLPAG